MVSPELLLQEQAQPNVFTALEPYFIGAGLPAQPFNLWWVSCWLLYQAPVTFKILCNTVLGSPLDHGDFWRTQCNSCCCLADGIFSSMGLTATAIELLAFSFACAPGHHDFQHASWGRLVLAAREQQADWVGAHAQHHKFWPPVQHCVLGGVLTCVVAACQEISAGLHPGWLCTKLWNAQQGSLYALSLMSCYLLWFTAATMSAFHLTTHRSSVQHENCSTTLLATHQLWYAHNSTVVTFLPTIWFACCAGLCHELWLHIAPGICWLLFTQLRAWAATCGAERLAAMAQTCHVQANNPPLTFATLPFQASHTQAASFSCQQIQAVEVGLKQARVEFASLDSCFTYVRLYICQVAHPRLCFGEIKSSVQTPSGLWLCEQSYNIMGFLMKCVLCTMSTHARW